MVNLRVREGFNISDVTFAEPDAEEAGVMLLSSQCDILCWLCLKSVCSVHIYVMWKVRKFCAF